MSGTTAGYSAVAAWAGQVGGRGGRAEAAVLAALAGLVALAVTLEAELRERRWRGRGRRCLWTVAWLAPPA